MRLGSTALVVEAVEPATFRVTSLTVDAKVAKIGQTIKVRAVVKNIGGVEGRFPGVLTLNGGNADASPVNIAPGETEELGFWVARDRAGACRLQLGTKSRTVMFVRPFRPANGTELKRLINGGYGRLLIDNRTRADVMVILAREGAPRTPVLAVYVRKNNETAVAGIPDGRYVIWSSAGRDWNDSTRDFLTIEEREKWRDPLEYQTTSTSRPGWQLTFGGTSASRDYTVPADGNEFPGL